MGILLLFLVRMRIRNTPYNLIVRCKEDREVSGASLSLARICELTAQHNKTAVPEVLMQEHWNITAHVRICVYILHILIAN